MIINDESEDKNKWRCGDIKDILWEKLRRALKKIGGIDIAVLQERDI
jgi:hypothetical protein